MNKLQFNIYCGTTEEAISEVEKLEKAFDKPIECYVNIVMDEQKEPAAVTVDSDELAKALRTNIPKDKVLSIDEVPRRYPGID